MDSVQYLRHVVYRRFVLAELTTGNTADVTGRARSLPVSSMTMAGMLMPDMNGLHVVLALDVRCIRDEGSISTEADCLSDSRGYILGSTRASVFLSDDGAACGTEDCCT